MNLTKEQREAIEYAADRAHVAALGKPIDGPEGNRWQAIRSLLDAPSADDVVHIGYTTQWDIDQMKIGGVGHFFSDRDEFEQNIATFVALPAPSLSAEQGAALTDVRIAPTTCRECGGSCSIGPERDPCGCMLEQCNFEDWLESRGLKHCFEMSKYGYVTPSVHTAWEAWKARAILAAAPTPEDAPPQPAADKVDQQQAYELGYQHALTSTQYTTAMGEAATAYFETFKHAHPLPAQFRWSEVYDAMARAAAKPASVDAQLASGVDADVIEFLTDVSQQKPEKPDYWSSCGQCERNQDRAEDLLAAIAQRAKEQS